MTTAESLLSAFKNQNTIEGIRTSFLDTKGLSADREWVEQQLEKSHAALNEQLSNNGRGRLLNPDRS